MSHQKLRPLGAKLRRRHSAGAAVFAQNGKASSLRIASKGIFLAANTVERQGKGSVSRVQVEHAGYAWVDGLDATERVHDERLDVARGLARRRADALGEAVLPAVALPFFDHDQAALGEHLDVGLAAVRRVAAEVPARGRRTC